MMEEKEKKRVGRGGYGEKATSCRKKDVLLINDSLYPVLVWRRNGSAKTAIGQSGRGDRREKMEPFALVGSRDLDGFFSSSHLEEMRH